MTDDLLTEDGGALLLEDGDNVLLESDTGGSDRGRRSRR